MLEKDGWYLVRTRGSRHQYKHPVKKGVVTVPGTGSDDLAPGTLNSILKQAGAEGMRKYLIVVEKTSTGFSAYSPDLEGCVSTGRTLEETEKNMREAIELHLEGMRLEGLPVPEPHTYSSYVQVSV